MEALLAAPDRKTARGQRDYALLLFLYNTGARANEAAQTTIADLHFAFAPRTGLSSVMIRGKGNKLRRCPPLVQSCRCSPSARRWSPSNGLRLSQSLRTTHNTLWDPWLGRAACRQGVGSTAGDASNACKPPHHSPPLRHPLVTRWRGHQHRPCVAGSRFIEHEQRLCRD